MTALTQLRPQRHYPQLLKNVYADLIMLAQHADQMASSLAALAAALPDPLAVDPRYLGRTEAAADSALLAGHPAAYFASAAALTAAVTALVDSGAAVLELAADDGAAPLTALIATTTDATDAPRAVRAPLTGVALALERATAVRTVTAGAVAVTASDHHLRADTTTGSVTFQLPTLAAVGFGKHYHFKDCGGLAASTPITIQAAPGEYIDGATTVALHTAYATLTVLAAAPGVWDIV